MKAVAWLHTFAMSALGLKIDDQVIWVATGLCFGMPCAALIPANIVGLGKGPARPPWVTLQEEVRVAIPNMIAVNNVIRRSLGSAKIALYLEPQGLERKDGKRLVGATVMPWKTGKILVWDATCLCHICRSSEQKSCSCQQSRERKYSGVIWHQRQPIEVSGVNSRETISLFFILRERELDRTIVEEQEKSSYIHSTRTAFRGHAAWQHGRFAAFNQHPELLILVLLQIVTIYCYYN